MLNRIRPSIDPWGTPHVTGFHLDFVPLITTPWARTFSQFSIHLAVCSSSPYINSFSMRILWERVSKAFLKSREGLVGDVMVGGCVGHSDHEMVEFKIFGVMRKKVSRVATLDLRRANFKLFRELVSSVPWESAFEGLGVHECWSVFKSHLLKAQEQAIPLCHKSSKLGRRPAWLNRELLVELKRRKKKLYDLWKQGQALQEDYRAVVHIRRKKRQKAKAELELKLAIFNNTDRPWAARSSELEDHDCGNSDFPFLDAEIVRDQLYHLNVHKSMGPDGIHPRVLKELVDVTAGVVSIIYQRS
ncbi:hypothetical protein QYF61_019779 [Mycteria americana]|uniref:Uncharacterized protein n=1 Tax=Mycteria americana TaxID=33587 RepID=A0AAN7NHY3_MYCAM|nr:hypothetical protein QYF61_019779 [Mycteria americana]